MSTRGCAGGVRLRPEAPTRRSRAMARRLAIRIELDGEVDRERQFAYVRAADEAGVETVFAPETWGRDVFSLLVQVAERTSRIQLGPGIVNVFSRSPAALAQHLATLDEISGG